MALIDCPECGREVSSSATACPECAYPLRSGGSSPKGGDTSQPSWGPTILSMAARIAVGFVLFAVGAEEGEASGIVGGVIIASSSIPTWYRARLDRLRSGRRDHQLEDRINDLERRYQEHLDHLEQTQTAQIADLEERLDFTERLLTKPHTPDSA